MERMSEPGCALASYRFDRFVLEPKFRLLTSDGVVVPLSSRGFDILQLLIEQRGRVVTKDEILDSVWSGTLVEENNLAVQISALRRALGSNGRAFITTVPGRGYRFVADVDEQRPMEPPEQPSARLNAADGDAVDHASDLLPASANPPPAAGWRRLAARIGLGVGIVVAAAIGVWLFDNHQAPPRLSIIVLPIRNLTDNTAKTYVADAITDDLTTELAHLPGSVVIARETADSMAMQNLTAAEIGRRLNVRYLLEGSLRAEDATLHINAQLVETRGGTHLWAQRFDVSQAHPGEARDQIVARLASALDIELVRVEASRTARRPDDADATDLFFRARSILDHDDTLHGFSTAQALLTRAVSLRPDFADAHAAIGEALLRKIRDTDDHDEAADHQAALAAIARALALSPGNGVALAAHAYAQFLDGHVIDAAYSARAELALDPNDIMAQDTLSNCALAQGRLDEAADALQTIMRLNPEGALSRQRALSLGTLRLLQGRLPEAEDWVRRSIAGDPDPQPGDDDLGRAEGARMLLIAIAQLRGRIAEAHTLYAQYERLWPHRSVWRIAAFTPRYMSALPGYARMAAALHAAGMPLHADEHADDHVPPSTAPLPETSFGATPVSLPGARTLDTGALAAMIRDHRASVIVDVGSGAAVIAGARWPGETWLTGTPPGQNVVIMSDGPYGSAGYNAALKRVQAGDRQVVWYRGGEEAWNAAGYPGVDLRP